MAAVADRDIPEEMVEKAAQGMATACGRGDIDTLPKSDQEYFRSKARAVLSAALAGRTVLDTRPDDLDPEALNAVANAVHDHYGFVRLDVRYRAAAAAIRIVEEWQATPIPGAAGSGVGDQHD